MQLHIRCYNTSSSPKHLPFKDCQTVGRAVQMIHDHLQTSTPRNLSAFWSSVPQLLKKSRFDQVQNIEQMIHQLDDILAHTLQDINSFDSRDLAQTTLGLAKIVKSVSGTDGKRLPRYGTPQRVLYDMIIGDKEFIFKVLAASSMNILHKFGARYLSNLIYAFGLADYVIKFEDDGSTLFDVFAQAAIPNLHTFNGQDLPNMLWSYANVKVSNSQLFEQAGDSIVKMNNLNEFWPQALSNTVWAYATLNESHPQLFKKIADHIIELDNLKSFNGQDCSNIVLAFAKAGESHPQLFKKLAGEAIKRQHEFNPQDTANFLWAYATNGQVNENLFASLVPSVKENLDKFNAQGLSNVVWAYTVANVDAPSVFNNEFINACLKKDCEFELEALLQLHQWQLWQEEIKSGVSLPPSLKKKCYETFISEDPSPSKLQDDVVSILSSMGLQPQEEVLLKSGYRVDAVVEVNGKQIAIEVDGPSHFIGKELTGSTILKHRQVAAVDGMKVVSIPYWEWNKLKKDSKRKEQYLQDLLGI